MWDIILHRIFGVGGEALERVRAGAGVVRNTTYVIVALWAAAVPILWALSPDHLSQIIATAIFALVTAIYLIGTWRFAERNPDQAVMGGLNSDDSANHSWLRRVSPRFLTFLPFQTH